MSTKRSHARARDMKISPIKRVRLTSSCSDISSTNSTNDFQYNLFLNELSGGNLNIRMSTPDRPARSPSSLINNTDAYLGSSNNMSQETALTSDTSFYIAEDMLFDVALNRPTTTVKEFSYLFLALQRRFRITDVAMKGILQLLQFIFPTPNKLPVSLDQLKRECNLKLLQEKSVTNKVCRICSKYFDNLCYNSVCPLYLKKQRPSEFKIFQPEIQLRNLINLNGALILKYLEQPRIGSLVRDLIESPVYEKLRPNPSNDDLNVSYKF